MNDQFVVHESAHTEGSRLEGYGILGEGAEALDSEIRDSVVSKNTRIVKSSVRGSVIGAMARITDSSVRDSQVGAESVLESCRVSDGAVVGSMSTIVGVRVEGAVIGSACRISGVERIGPTVTIPSGTRIRGDGVSEIVCVSDHSGGWRDLWAIYGQKNDGEIVVWLWGGHREKAAEAYPLTRDEIYSDRFVDIVKSYTHSEDGVSKAVDAIRQEYESVVATLSASDVFEAIGV